MLVVYGGLLGADLTAASTQRPDRLHPHAGQGLSAGQRAAARRGLGASGREQVDAAQIEEIAPARPPGVKHTVGHRRAVDAAERQRSELRLDVRDARPISTSGTRTTSSTPTRSPTKLRPSRPGRDPRRAWSTSSARRRRRPGHRRRLQDHDRGPRRRRPAPRCRADADELVAAGERDRRAAWACSPASAPTRRGSTSTSTATKCEDAGRVD